MSQCCIKTITIYFFSIAYMCVVALNSFTMVKYANILYGYCFNIIIFWGLLFVLWGKQFVSFCILWSALFLNVHHCNALKMYSSQLLYSVKLYAYLVSMVKKIVNYNKYPRINSFWLKCVKMIGIIWVVVRSHKITKDSFSRLYLLMLKRTLWQMLSNFRER